MLTSRETIIITIDEYIDIDLTDFSKIRLEHPVKGKVGRPIDIGSLVYSLRMPSNKINQQMINDPTPVDINTLKSERLNFIKEFSTEFHNKKPNGCETVLKEIIPIFDWMDNNSHSDFLLNSYNMKKSYSDYTNHLVDRVHNNELTARTAKDKQWYLEKIINISFENEKKAIIAGIPKIKNTTNARNPISSERIDYKWDLFLEMFNKFYVEVNFTYENMTNDIEVNNSNKNEVDKYIEKIKNKGYTYEAVQSVFRARARSSFIQLFRILTGINRAELIKLKFTNSLKITRNKISQDFHEIKFRAGNRDVLYTIQKDGYQLFKKYLILRQLTVLDNDFEFLFFNVGDPIISREPKKLSAQHSDQFYNFLRNHDIVNKDETPLKDHEIRSASTIYLRKKGYTSKQVADHKNHTIETSEKIYSTPTIEQQTEELGYFWDAIKQASTLNKKNIKTKNKSIITGSCNTLTNNPESIIKNPPISPDCESFQGCLFCKHYVCHADEEDIKKLLSFLYIINYITETTIEQEYSDLIYGMIKLRINFILEELEKSHLGLVKNLKKHILIDGNLSKFWNDRLDHYEEMGLIKK